MERNLKITIASILGLMVFINFIFIPFLHHREVTRIIDSVLHYWQGPEFSKAYEHWEEYQKSPPIYDLQDYKIVKRAFGKADGVRTATFYIILNFPVNNPTPSGKTWVFELKKTRLGWKIVECYPLSLPAL